MPVAARPSRPQPPLPSPPPLDSPLRLAGNGTARELHCRVLQSPLAGVSDRIFRRLVRRWAPRALLYTEMVHAGELGRGRGGRRLEGLDPGEGPVAVQLFDHRPAAMAEAARRAEAAGAFLVDVNMGCPVRKVARRGGGSGLLRDPDLAARVVEAVAGAVRVPVTVKMRLGWSAADADPVGFARRLQEAGAQLLTVHGRTRAQGYDGRADWEAIDRVRRCLAVPVIANGDVDGPEAARRCLAVSGAAGVMVGRATLGAPWQVGRIDAVLRGLPPPPEPDAAARLALAQEHLEALLAVWGEHGLQRGRRHLVWTCRGFPGDEALRRALVRAATPAEALGLLAAAQGSTAGQPWRISSSEK